MSQFQELLSLPLAYNDRKILASLIKAQRQYPILTFKKYLLYYTIRSKYITDDVLD